MVDIELLSEHEAGQLLGTSMLSVHAQVRDGQLISVRIDGRRGIPADFIQDGQIVKHLSSVLTQLRDARFTEEEMLEWLYRPDDSLPGTPLQALRENRGTEVKRRAQVAGF